MLRSVTANRCRHHARPRGTCLASARKSAANSRLKPSRGNGSTSRLRTAGALVAPQAEDVNCRAGGHEIRLGAGLKADTGAVMHGDRVGLLPPAVGGYCVAVADPPGQRG